MTQRCAHGGRSGAERNDWGRDLGAEVWVRVWDSVGFGVGPSGAKRSFRVLSGGGGGVVGAGLWAQLSEAELGGYWRGVGAVGEGAKRSKAPQVAKRRLGVVSDSALCVPTRRRR